MINLKPISMLIYLLIGTITTVLLSRFHIEWMWFEQFGYEHVLLKRLTLQGIFLITAIMISIFHIYIQKKLLYNIPRKEANKKITGFSFTLILTISLLSTYLFITILTIIASGSLNIQLHSIYWWDYSSYSHIKLISLLSIVTTTLIMILFRKKNYLYLQYITTTLFVLIVVRSWQSWSLAIAIPQTYITEEVFGADLSFALGQYPAILYLLTLLLLVTFTTISISSLKYLTRNSNLSDWSCEYLSRSQVNIARPLIILLTTNILSISWISRHAFLWTQRGIVPGAGWLDLNFNIPIRTFTCFCLLILLVQYIPFKYKYKDLISIFTSFLLFLSIITELLFTPLLEWILVRPKELKLEAPFLERSIKATRRSFQLDSIKTKLINPKSKISKKDLELGESTLKNIRLWDTQPLLDTNRQLQQLRQYYRFTNVAIDRYRLKPKSKERQQVMITARELDQNQLPESSRTWLNRHFVFTHGYGFTVSPINSKAEDGLPEYFIKDLGDSTKIEGSIVLDISKEDVKNTIPIGRAAIYYGLIPSSYVIAPSKIKELDYPQGDQNIFNHYQGKGGISLSNHLQRLSASIFLGEPRVLNTGSLTKNSKLLIRREVRNRVKAIAPFLDVIGDPYLVTVDIPDTIKNYQNDQHQYWIVEGYTSSINYPYSSKLPDGQPIRYIRNSVKAIVDSYNGNVKLYIVEEDDPLINAWRRLFPNLFEDISNMPNSIKEHLRVPIELFNIKVQQILRYHVTDSRTFYNGDDLWQVPMELYGTEEIPVEPYHITAQLGDNQESEFLLLQPLSPLARPNLAAWLAARNDGKNYGELVLLRFPSETSIFGPEQIQALINQNPSISQQFTLWDRAGSEVIQGNLLVLPLGSSLLYVEPVYLKARMGGLPTLTRVVVSDGKRIAMAETLTEGIKELLNQFNNDSK